MGVWDRPLMVWFRARNSRVKTSLCHFAEMMSPRAVYRDK